MQVRARPQSRRARWGGSVAEMAAIMPLFLMLVLGQIESARLGMVAQLLTNAARDGCRLAVLSTTTSTSTVQSRINSVLSGSGISFSSLTATNSDPGTSGAYIMPSSWTTASSGTSITVTLRLPYSQTSWLPSPYFLKTAKVTASVTMNSEKP